MAEPWSDEAPEPRMSLSRRFLSLPQELTGCSLPPKVSGRRLGSVCLCVTHVLDSAVASKPLPSVSLVRVRWWGEDAPGSLFRPSLLSDGARVPGAGESDAPQRAIAMRYPVSVAPATLLEYFQDMKQLSLDVIDRSSRKKYGQCSLSLEVAKDNAVMTAEEKLVMLRRDNALCEIQAIEDENEVLGERE
ncbi:Lysophospholipid acyltransferase 1 [Phytophthora boehmeriae]|uniref:Lysophospholipid acyltransferase 1 n=1 Tax=Phytophthora boehmeriae TaxID=109152 RepID=A0A8T1WZ22_9STRA|nr:Lysophospholipid acyltransferase 1 [Phytophthora boehmeriae]